MLGRVLRALILLMGASSLLGTAMPSRTLTFEDRVRAQEAIERVYYSHQIGATKSFEEAVPREAIEQKVLASEAKAQALERFWQTAMTGQALQSELNRIATKTKYPERLHEIYAALGNDPVLIAETFARDSLVKRMSQKFFTWDRRVHGEARVEAERIAAQIQSGTLDPMAKDPRRALIRLLPVSKRLPLPRRSESQPELDLEREEFMQIRAKAFGGPGGEVIESPEGFTVAALLRGSQDKDRLALYTVKKFSWKEWLESIGVEVRPIAPRRIASDYQLPAPLFNGSPARDQTPPCLPEDTWNNGQLDDSPGARGNYAMVWTGSEMIVWGGETGAISNASLSSGSRYDPLVDSWTAMSNVNAPSGRILSAAVWTGSEMIVWGGRENSNYYNTGGRYNPATDAWSALPLLGAPSPREDHLAVWTGNQMIVWGGRDNNTTLVTGGRYTPSTDSWSSVSTLNAPSPRGFGATAVWTDGQMIVWGGIGSASLNTGGRYNPTTDTWSSTSTSAAPTARFYHTALWTGARMIIWGGRSGSGDMLTGGAYDPADDNWTATPTFGAPSRREHHSAVWTGSQMIVWGGVTFSAGTRQYLNDGARLDPVTGVWSPVSLTNQPAPRASHSAIWTGSLMLIWGGLKGDCCGGIEAGGRYDPSADLWTPITSNGAPAGRDLHSAIWTGNTMVVWGGTIGISLNSGGQYDVLTDSWTATSVVNAPVARVGHAAVWTGQDMIIWGGYEAEGGRYDPILDTWSAIQVTQGTPSARGTNTTIWTGSEMIIWGGHDTHTALNTGARYNPVSGLWTTLPLTAAPSPRQYAIGIWTGTDMLIWGGLDSAGIPLRNGGRFNPDSNTWTSISSTNAPPPHSSDAAVWTGSEMMIWGSDPNSAPSNTGGRYHPATDSWTQVSTVNAPSPRTGHTAVWTGREAVVWGGNDPYRSFNSGGRYDPQTDAWLATSELSAPAPRGGHTAVWTGSEMIIWGGSGVSTGGRYTLGLTVDDDDDGFSECSGDCNDADPAVNPASFDECNGIDDNCDGRIDEPFDLDGDFHATCTGDCDDDNPAIFTGAPQTCDGFNNDCSTPGWPELDGTNEADDDHDGTSECQGDCVDSDARTYRNAPEINDGRDNQCPGDHGFGARDEISGDAGFPDINRPTDYCWTPQAGAEKYLTARANDPEFKLGCVRFSETTLSCLVDAEVPAPGETFYYLVRANTPESGSWGQDSTGAERVGICSAPTFSFSFVDTFGDDVTNSALSSYFASVSATPSSYIFFEVAGSPTGGAWCSERADFYRDTYITNAAGASTIPSGAWRKWYRNGMGPWSTFTTVSHLNYYGSDCLEPWSWCTEYGLGNLLLDVRPAGPAFCEIEDDNLGCNAGTWRLTIRVSEDRISACGF